MIPDLATLRDRAKKHVGEGRLRDARDGLARLGAPLAALRDGLAAARRPRDAARRLGAHGRVVRLRGGHRAGMARDDLPAVLRRRRHLRGLRHGAHAGDPAAQDLRPRRLHHDEAPRQHGEDPAGHRAHRRLRVRRRGLHGLLQRQPLRALHAHQPPGRPVPAHVLGPARSAISSRPQVLWFRRVRRSIPALFVRRDDRERRHVARALRDRRREPFARLPAVVVGHVPRDDLRLGHLRRLDRPLHRAALPLHPAAADDLDLRDARDPARGAASRRRTKA